MAERLVPVPIPYPAEDDTCGSALLNLFGPTNTAAVVTAVAPVFASLAHSLF